MIIAAEATTSIIFCMPEELCRKIFQVASEKKVNRFISFPPNLRRDLQGFGCLKKVAKED